jgi:hypothetical protein
MQLEALQVVQEEMVDLVKDIIRQELMGQEGQEELKVDVLLMVVQEILERLVVMVETGDHLEESPQIQDQVEQQEEQFLVLTTL